MAKNNEYELQIPGMLRDEIQRIFDPILAQQLRNHQHQVYHLSLGTRVLKDVRLEIWSVPQAENAEKGMFQMKYFQLECIPEGKYEKIFQTIVQRLRTHSANGYIVKSNKKNPNRNAMEYGEQASKTNGILINTTISGEICQNDFSVITSILGELGMTASEFDTKVSGKKIGYVTGNLLSQNSKIPIGIPRVPEIKNRVSRDIFDTIEELNGTSKKTPRLLTRKWQAIQAKTSEYLKIVQAKSAYTLSLRDSTYSDAKHKEEILSDYQQALEIILPNEVCQKIIWHRENDGFEIQMWFKDMMPLYLWVGEFNRKYGERSIGFSISIKEENADKLWDELAENFKKNSKEVGEYGFEVTYPEAGTADTEGEATIILEMPIQANHPEKIRNLLFLFWKLLYEYGYRFDQSPEIINSFENSNRELQKIAKNVLKKPKIKPSVDR